MIPSNKNKIEDRADNRKIKGIRKDRARASEGRPARAKGGDTDARLNAVLQSHAELCVALRAAGRWMLRRAVSQRDHEALDRLREVLRQAEAVSGRTGTTEDSIDLELERYQGESRSERIGASSGDFGARILVLPNRRLTLRELQ